ncbi:MAG TPA: nitroreductase family protein, partial [Ilumatobacteraceae bacterium]|nr:nitroreductase family protein [Ilumatobacteraceae bacterium]
GQPGEEGDDPIHPPNLWEPYRSSRFKVGEDMYATIGIAREDKAGRLAQFAKNLDFFGAPAAVFCFVDRIMGPPQWSDLGMFLQTFMLLAIEAGLDTCPQEAWCVHEQAVSEFVGAPPEQRIFCGVALGHADHIVGAAGVAARRPRPSDQQFADRARTRGRLRPLRLTLFPRP